MNEVSSRGHVILPCVDARLSRGVAASIDRFGPCQQERRATKIAAARRDAATERNTVRDVRQNMRPSTATLASLSADRKLAIATLSSTAQRRTEKWRAVVGANPYFYFAPYQKDIQAALQALREREFKAGRYDPAMQTADPPTYMFQMRFPPDESWPAPGAQHSSIEEAIDASMESGTGSILDLFQVGSVPDFCTVCPLEDQELVQLFGTTTPTREQLENALLTKWKPGSPAFHLFWDRIERGQGRYIVTYSGSEPSEIFFVGYSFD